MSELTGQKHAVAHSEAIDYDAVATWTKDRTQSFAPIQLKEVPPTALNPTASMQEVINGLAKYPRSEGLTVVVHLNQATRFLSSKLSIPPLRIAALWVFAGISPDQSRWSMWGNLVEPVDSWQVGAFDYPEPGVEITQGLTQLLGPGALRCANDSARYAACSQKRSVTDT